LSIRFGEGQISNATIVDVDSSNPQATLIADLAEPGSLPADVYDCIILKEVLHLVAAPDVCIQNCGTALRGGGSLPVTVPALKRLSPVTLARTSGALRPPAWGYRQSRTVSAQNAYPALGGDATA